MTRDATKGAPGEDAVGLPVIDVGPLVSGIGDRVLVAAAIGRACREHGFFYVVGHGVDAGLLRRLEQLGRRFFALPAEQKEAIRMERGGRAWRGYFGVGGELTSGRPDLKEGLYFGAELPEDHPRVRAGVPLHGKNLFPSAVPDLRGAVLETIAAMTRVGHAIMEGIALSLGLDARYFAERYTGEPLVLFRLFNYPPAPPSAAQEPSWGVGEHTDYGLLTLLWQDDAGGLQVKSGTRWLEAPPIPGSFVCNIGDMLDRMTRGRYRSTPHRVVNAAGRDRLSFPFFFDPDWDAEVRPIEAFVEVLDDHEERWDQASVHEFRGTYGDYLLGKVSKVFPELRRDVLP
ncbi:isopenicillin N synthase family dioxygenase [Chondromyces crocatus]|uniref:2-oxoglutarate-dependent ethylene/succinate-forming enzyme n=1 Tax=Chondromyces crocatus TaxID=52 RepID=A0A0K1ETL4_CHOCO|nr:2-oxoglutarate and iron-dependent oxygenase domain-containing protein [Chondromyces crocatus]AKT44124.1 iron oxidase [Chondromyces crocatus]